MSANEAQPITVSADIDKNLPNNDAPIDARYEILPGGVVWSEHGGYSQELMVVTRQGVYCYKVSLRRNTMSKTRFLAMSQTSLVSFV